MPQLDLYVVGVGFGADLDFFDLNPGLLFSGLLLSFILLVFEAAIIHDLAYRRACVGGDFHKIKAKFLRRRQCGLYRNNPQLIAIRINDPHFFFFNILVCSGCIAALFFFSYADTSCFSGLRGLCLLLFLAFTI